MVSVENCGDLISSMRFGLLKVLKTRPSLATGFFHGLTAIPVKGEGRQVMSISAAVKSGQGMR